MMLESEANGRGGEGWMTSCDFIEKVMGIQSRIFILDFRRCICTVGENRLKEDLRTLSEL